MGGAGTGELSHLRWSARIKDGDSRGGIFEDAGFQSSRYVSFDPPGLVSLRTYLPTACAVGFILSPLSRLEFVRETVP